MCEYKIKWLFITNKEFIKCGPYNTDGEFSGYSVGLQTKGDSVNRSIMGTGSTFNEAVERALQSERGKKFIKGLL